MLFGQGLKMGIVVEKELGDNKMEIICTSLELDCCPHGITKEYGVSVEAFFKFCANCICSETPPQPVTYIIDETGIRIICKRCGLLFEQLDNGCPNCGLLLPNLHKQ